MTTFNRARNGGLKAISTGLAALTLVAGTMVATAPAQARDRTNDATVDRADNSAQTDDNRGRRDSVARGLAYGLGGAALGYTTGNAYRGYGAPRYGYDDRARYDYRYGRPAYGYGHPGYYNRYGG